jgi:hypothetical protein
LVGFPAEEAAEEELVTQVATVGLEEQAGQGL